MALHELKYYPHSTGYYVSNRGIREITLYDDDGVVFTHQGDHFKSPPDDMFEAMAIKGHQSFDPERTHHQWIARRGFGPGRLYLYVPALPEDAQFHYHGVHPAREQFDDLHVVYTHQFDWCGCRYDANPYVRRELTPLGKRVNDVTALLNRKLSHVSLTRHDVLSMIRMGLIAAEEPTDDTT